MSSSLAHPAADAMQVRDFRDPRARRVAIFGWWFFAEHRIRAMRSYLGSWFVTSLGEPFIYLLGLGVGLGVLVDQSQGSIDGVPYLTFLAPALAMAAVMQTSAQENTYGVFGGFKWHELFFAASSTPLRPWHLAVGFQVATFARVLLLLVAFAAAIAVFGIGPPIGAFALIPIGFLLSVAVGFAVMSWVATRKNDRGQLNFVERFVVVPLTLFSGTYFPLDTLPIFLQWIGWISPLWHSAELARIALYGAAVAPAMIVVHVGFLALLAGVTCAMSVRTFRKRLGR